MSEKFSFIDAMDTAAAALLERAGIGGKLQGEQDPKDRPDLAESVKAFQAVMTWVDKRRELAPAQQKDSKFEQLAEQFHGAASSRGRSSRGPEKTPSAGLFDEPGGAGSH